MADGRPGLRVTRTSSAPPSIQSGTHPVAVVFDLVQPAVARIRDHPIAPRSPWQNGHAERLIGSIRRECLDHVVVFGEAHLHRILATYAAYYNECRTHLALDKGFAGRVGRSNGLASSLLGRSSADCIISIVGFSFW